MSVREEDRQKNCPGRGLGIAAAAIGVGVGAALYYFFNKRNENPDAEGSTTNWNCEDTALQESLNNSKSTNMDISSESDMDVSIESDSDESHDTTSSSDSTETEFSSDSDSEDSDGYRMFDTLYTISEHSTIDEIDWQNDDENSYVTISEHSTTDTSINITSDNDVMELNNSGSSIEYIGTEDVEEHNALNIISISILGNLFRSRNRVNPRSSQRRPNEEIQRLANIREQAFRERSWAVEECSICFEPMHREHEVLALPCTHRFHQSCIMPWLQERQTCPNCRKEA